MNLTPTDQARILCMYFPNTNVSHSQELKTGTGAGVAVFTPRFNFLPSDVRRQS